MPPTPITTLSTIAMDPIGNPKSCGLSIIIMLLVASGAIANITIQDTNQHDTTRIARHIAVDSVVITSKTPNRRNSEYAFSPLKAKEITTLLGETDVIRYLGTIPGVSQGMEGGMAFYVRGSNSSNNRIELDGVPVYGSTHLFGLVSTFHADIIDSATFRMGGIPASSGDFLASVTSISTLMPSVKTSKKGLSISPFIAGASFCGIIPKTQLGILAAARTLTLRPLLLITKKVTPLEADINPEVIDAYTKVTRRINEHNTLSLSGYISNDFFEFDIGVSDLSMNWGNKLASLIWEHKHPDGIRVRTQAYANQFQSGQQFIYYSEDGQLESALRMRTSIGEINASTTFWFDITRWSLMAGGSFSVRQFSPAAEKVLVGQSTSNEFGENSRTQNHNIFAAIAYRNSFLAASFGVRQSAYLISKNHTWLTDIRVSAKGFWGSKGGVEITYDKLSQTHHTLEGLPMGWAIDLMIPADNQFPVQYAHQLYTGAYGYFEGITASLGAYIKSMNNLISYSNSTNIFGVQNTSWHDEIAIGKGDSRGIEARVEKSSSTWSGSIAYTLSKTTRQFPEINQGKPFPFKFDRRHILNILTQIKLPVKKEAYRSINATLSLSSGHYTTLATAMYKGAELPFWSAIGDNYRTLLMNQNSWGRQLVSQVNGVKMPVFIRLDIGYATTRVKAKYTREISYGLYNVLNIQNPYLYFYHDYSWKQLSILPIVPSISYRVNF